MKQSRISLMVTAVLLAAACPAAAQQAPAQVSYKIGFVNTERVMREARAPQQAQKSIDAEFQKREQEIAAAEERLGRMAAELEKSGASLAAADRQKREREASDLQNDIERRKRAFSDELNLRRDEALKQIIEQANAVIRRIAEEERFDAVFVEAAYANPRIDITAKVIKALDEAR